MVLLLGDSMPASYVSYDQCRSGPSCVRPERLRVSLVTRVRVFTRGRGRYVWGSCEKTSGEWLLGPPPFIWRPWRSRFHQRSIVLRTMVAPRSRRIRWSAPRSHLSWIAKTQSRSYWTAFQNGNPAASPHSGDRAQPRYDRQKVQQPNRAAAERDRGAELVYADSEQVRASQSRSYWTAVQTGNPAASPHSGTEHSQGTIDRRCSSRTEQLRNAIVQQSWCTPTASR